MASKFRHHRQHFFRPVGDVPRPRASRRLFCAFASSRRAPAREAQCLAPSRIALGERRIAGAAQKLGRAEPAFGHLDAKRPLGCEDRISNCPRDFLLAQLISALRSRSEQSRATPHKELRRLLAAHRRRPATAPNMDALSSCALVEDGERRAQRRTARCVAGQRAPQNNRLEVGAPIPELPRVVRNQPSSL